MSRQSLVLALVAGIVFAALPATACHDGLSPAEALAASRASFAGAESFQVRLYFRTESGDASATTEGQAAYQSHDLVYSRMIFTGEALGQQGITELLFLPPDLYIRTSDGSWFVLSPWSQGIKPEEQKQLGPGDPIVDYDGIINHLSGIEELGDETIDGEDYARYTAVIDPGEVPSAVPPDVVSTYPFAKAQATANLVLWLHKESYLPRKMQISAQPDRRQSSPLTFVFDFLDYDLPITRPQPPLDVRPWRDVELPEAPCTGSLFAPCLTAQTQLQPIARGTCDGGDERICIAPLGHVSPALVQHLVDHYQDQYGLAITILTPTTIPEELSNPLREQVDASTLIDYMQSRFPDAYNDPSSVLIGLAPVDLYAEDSHFRYVFGVKGNPNDPKAVISSFRMNPETYGDPANDELFFARVRKLLSKYIGLLYYVSRPARTRRAPSTILFSARTTSIT